MFRSAILALVALACLGAPGSAQAVRLARPDGRLAEEFSSVQGARELPDGRLLVSDYRDQRVVVVDFARGTVARTVAQGGGPAEARLPASLVPIPGDSTALVDLGNQRLLILDPDGRPRRAIAGDVPGAMGLRGIDTRGRWYYAIPGWMERAPLPNDSVRIVVRDPDGGPPTTVAVIQGQRMRSDIRKPSRVPRIPVVGYGSRDAWVVGGDGTIRIVRGDGYRVEIVRAGAAPVAGPSYAGETRPVTAADKERFVRDFNATSPMSGRGEGGAAMGFSPAMSDREVAEMVAGTEFAERHPAFLASSVLAAPDGQLWVGLPVADGTPVRYDVFDAAGRRRTTVELGTGRRVIAVGRSYLYVVEEDEDGIQRLERYRVPG